MKVERGRPLRPQTRYPCRSFRSNFQYFCELHRTGNIGSNFARVSEQSIDGFRLRLRKESNTSSTRRDNRESERGHVSRFRITFTRDIDKGTKSFRGRIEQDLFAQPV